MRIILLPLLLGLGSLSGCGGALFDQLHFAGKASTLDLSALHADRLVAAHASLEPADDSWASEVAALVAAEEPTLLTLRDLDGASGSRSLAALQSAFAGAGLGYDDLIERAPRGVPEQAVLVRHDVAEQFENACTAAFHAQADEPEQGWIAFDVRRSAGRLRIVLVDVSVADELVQAAQARELLDGLLGDGEPALILGAPAHAPALVAALVAHGFLEVGDGAQGRVFSRGPAARPALSPAPPATGGLLLRYAR